MGPKSVSKYKTKAKIYTKAYLNERAKRIEAENKLATMSKAFMDEQDRRMDFECKYEVAKNRNKVLNDILYARKQPWYKKLLTR